MLDNQQTVTTYDVAETLRNEDGFFLVQRAGQTCIVEAATGHSIKSWTPVGNIEPSNLPAGTNPPFAVSRINLGSYQSQGRGQQQQSLSR